MAPRSSTLDEYNRICTAVYEYIEEHFAEDITIDSFCEATRYSKRSVQRALQDGHTWRGLLLDRRIFEAKELLMQGLTTAEVAQQIGYSHPSALVSAFKSRTGVTPTEFRREYNRNGGK